MTHSVMYLSAPPCSRATDQGPYESAISDAKTARAVSLTGFVLGGAALVTGVVLLATVPKSNTASLRIAPTVDPVGRVGAALQGAF